MLQIKCLHLICNIHYQRVMQIEIIMMGMVTLYI